MTPGDVYLANFPYGDAPGMKLRPVLLLTGRVGPVPEALVAYISSAVPATLLATDILIDPSQAEHARTNLKTTSVLRLHKLASIHTRIMARRLGEISPATRAEVDARLRILLNL